MDERDQKAMDEELNQPSCLGAVISSADYNHLLKLMNEINAIMWESYMIEGKEFGRTEGYKIMSRLEQWAKRH